MFPIAIKGQVGYFATAVDCSAGCGRLSYRWSILHPDCAELLAKRTLTKLYNERPTWLELAHRKLDAAVFAAYGWKADMGDDELLAALLALNLERARESRRAE